MALRFESIPGLVSYEEGLRIQAERVADRIKDLIPDTILFLEHAPVVTRGRGLQQPAQKTQNTSLRAMPFDPSSLPKEIAFIETDRGGDLTYHGPGQLVVYPILKLDGSSALTLKNDVGNFIRKLEDVVIRLLSQNGVEAFKVPDATGIWVQNRTLKIASIGLNVKKWVTSHGVALNVVNDLKPFSLFSPCGFNSEVMTRLSDHVSKHNPLCGEQWRAECENQLTRIFVSEHTPPRLAASPPAIP